MEVPATIGVRAGFCAKGTAFLIRKTRFKVSWKIVTGFAAIVSVSPAIDSDTSTTVCSVLTGVNVPVTAVRIVLTAVTEMQTPVGATQTAVLVSETIA